MTDDHRPSEFLAAEPVSESPIDANERVAAFNRSFARALDNPQVYGERVDATFKPPSLVGRLPQKEYDAAIVDAAVRLNAELDGCEICAPGAIGEALRMLRNAVVNARRV